MIVDFAGCWLIELVCKYLFAELEPKAIITRGRERREKRRRLEGAQKATTALGSDVVINGSASTKLKVQ